MAQAGGHRGGTRGDVRVGIGVGTAGTLATTPSPAPADKEFALIHEAWDTLHKQYVARAELDDQALAWGSIKGMTQAVGDTGHTSFMTPAERAANAAGLSGSYVGIGVKVDAAADGLPLDHDRVQGQPGREGRP